MKRSRSGARPSGGAKNLAKHHARYNYALCVFNADGDLLEPTEAELEIFRTRHPEIAQKMEEASQNCGLPAGSWQEKCFGILDGMVKTKRALWFRAAVDPIKEHLPDYFTVIKQPMDLGTVKTRLLGNYYSEQNGFAADVRLTFQNAMAYNVATTLPHQDALKLLAQFDKKFAFNFEQPSVSGLESEATTTGAAEAVDVASAASASAAPAASATAATAAAPEAAGASADSAGASAGPSSAADDDWGAEPSAPGEQPKAVISDDDDDDDDDDEEEGDATADGGDKSAGGEATEHPSTGGKAPGGLEDSGMDETAESEADLSDSALGSEGGGESGDEGVSEADMFGDDDEGFDEVGGEEGGDSFQEESEAEGDGAYDGTGTGGESSMADGEEQDSVFDEEGEDETG